MTHFLAEGSRERSARRRRARCECRKRRGEAAAGERWRIDGRSNLSVVCPVEGRRAAAESREPERRYAPILRPSSGSRAGKRKAAPRWGGGLCRCFCRRFFATIPACQSGQCENEAANPSSVRGAVWL